MNELNIVRGTVADLQITKAYEDFAFSEGSKSAIGAGAVTAAAMGDVFNSAVLAVGLGGAEIDVEYFTCVVEGNRLAGRFHRVGFKDGDDVEFVCDRMGDVQAVLAARDPNKRLLWTLPYHARGDAAQNKMAIKWIIGFSLVASSATMLISLPSESSRQFSEGLMEFVPMFLICLAVGFFVRSFFVRHGKAATSIFAALGYKNPSQVDMKQIDHVARKKSRSDQHSGAQELWTYHY